MDGGSGDQKNVLFAAPVLLVSCSGNLSTTSCPPPFMLLGPIKGNAHWQSAPFKSLSHRFVCSTKWMCWLFLQTDGEDGTCP